MTLEPDTSLDLFDIDENEYEHEHDYQDQQVNASFSQDLEAHRQNSFVYPTFAPPILHQGQTQIFGQSAFSDLFHPGGNNNVSNSHLLNTIGESVEHHFHAAQQQQGPYFDDVHSMAAFYNPLASHITQQFNPVMLQPYHSSAFLPLHNSIVPLSVSPQIKSCQQGLFSGFNPNTAAVVASMDPSDCSVCLAVRPSTLAVLQPCGHPLCSACLTSALNIVGEKDMECAVCNQGVLDFRLVTETSKLDLSSKFGSAGAIVLVIINMTLILLFS